MLARLTGILESIEDGTALIVLPGTHPGTEQAFEVMLPAFLCERLQSRCGGLLTLHTIQSLESASQGSSFTPRLIGFLATDERRFFEVLTTVKGVGTKKALRALASPVSEVARAITLRDATMLAQLPGIGKRMAETIIAELHGKVEPFLAYVGDGSSPSAGTGMIGSAESESVRRAVAALVRLGETESQAQTLVRRALEVEPKITSADELVSAALGAR